MNNDKSYGTYRKIKKPVFSEFQQAAGKAYDEKLPENLK